MDTMEHPRLHLREREVLEAVHRLGRASAVEIGAEMPSPPSDSAIRTHLRILEEKGYVQHVKEGRKFLYFPTRVTEASGISSLRHLVRTFFSGAPEKALATLITETADDLSEENLDHLDELIRQAREKKK